jgi:putative aldouronate transport system substrate-binding protein
MRPGLGIIDDATAFVSLAPNDWLYYDGALHVEPIELSQMTLSLPFPNHPYVAPTFHEPVLMFTTEENDEIARNMQPIYTFIDETVLRYINGTANFNTWDSTFINGINRMGDINRVLQIYNDAAARYYAAAGR